MGENLLFCETDMIADNNVQCNCSVCKYMGRRT